MTVRTLPSQPAHTSALRRLLARRPLAAFFGLAFGISWAFLIADGLGSRGLIPFRLTLSGPGLLLTLLMSYGPTIAALVVAWATGGAAEARALLARALPWRARPRWYLLALLGPIALALVAGWLQTLFGAALPPLPGPAYQVALMGLVGSIVHAIANGEELGWRGYALARLQERYSALAASLILGAIWFAFHLPIMFTAGGIGGSQTPANAPSFLAGTLALSVVITWMLNSARGGVLPVILLHGALNTWIDLLTNQKASPALVWVGQVPLLLLAAIIVLRCGPARLARVPASERIAG